MEKQPQTSGVISTGADKKGRVLPGRAAQERAVYLADRMDEVLNRCIRPRLDQWYWLRFYDADAKPPGHPGKGE